jgi:hypothetical protein
LYNERPQYAKGTVENEGIKLSLNGAFGKSNDQFSPLYDTKFFMQITINGQLLLTMLAEKLALEIEDLTMLQINTDGITVKIKRSDEKKVLDICKSWEHFTLLNLEYVEYKKMVIRDVNNYCAVYTNGKYKAKGCFEIDKDYHKDHSMKIIPTALIEYFVNDIPVKDTLKNGNIHDFCKVFTTTKGWKAVLFTVIGKIQLQKTNRYIVVKDSKFAAGFYKEHEDGRLNAIEASQSVVILNKISDIHNLDSFKENLNMSYYTNEVYKIINTIENRQLELF